VVLGLLVGDNELSIAMLKPSSVVLEPLTAVVGLFIIFELFIPKKLLNEPQVG
jgi:hypothetical protein